VSKCSKKSRIFGWIKKFRKPGIVQKLNSNMEAISKHEIIGPYWFEDENERTQTVNTEHYVAVLRKFLDITPMKQRD